MKPPEMTADDFLKLPSFDYDSPQLIAEMEFAKAIIAARDKQWTEMLGEPVPLESSEEAAKLIKAMLFEYGYPANPTNAARAGWRACRLYAPKKEKPE